MDLRQLTYFLAIAEEGQITAAARRLNMAQPPLSQQMKALEEELGVELFLREPRSVTLTDAGEILYRRARQLITLADSTRREIGDFKSGLRGTLSIGTVSSSAASSCGRPFGNFTTVTAASALKSTTAIPSTS